jgi:hypothetical protein
MDERSEPAADETRYELRELAAGPTPLQLGVRYSGMAFLDAVDAALEFLDEHDPEREGKVTALEIVRVEPAERTVVWRYCHDAAPPLDPIRVWGFDVTRSWRGTR